ncbi:MAG: inner membrane CreD family protein [Armatimonadota bacterium]
MNPGRIVAVIVILAVASCAWMILGHTVVERMRSGYQNINPEVQSMWGQPLVQYAPTATTGNETIDLSSSTIATDLQLEYRRRGLLWFAGYKVKFDGTYQVSNTAAKPRDIALSFAYPSANASYDEFIFTVNGQENWQRTPDAAKTVVHLAPGKSATIHIGYRTRGMSSWSYAFGQGVQRVRNFALVVNTDFKDIDFPQGTISPTTKKPTADGYELGWKAGCLLSGFNVGVAVPEKLNPGDVASRISFFAPIGLLFFFVVMLVWCLIRGINLHPMHFGFLAAGFFAFHLLFAYLVDHVNIFNSFLIATGVSLILVVNYMRLAIGLRHALVPTALAQIVYLILFSYAFFFKGYTGLTITIGAILTLAMLMQVTARVDWEQVFAAKNGKVREVSDVAKEVATE